MEALENSKDLNKLSKSSRHDSILAIVLAPNHSSLITKQYEHNSYEFIHQFPLPSRFAVTTHYYSYS
jgi:hypothetical protein